MATAQKIVTDRFRFYNSNNFFNAITLGKEYIYIYLSRCYRWSENDDPNLVTLVDSHKTQIDTWDDIIAISRLLPGDCFRVIKSVQADVQWSSKVYDQYDDSVSMKNKNFYIIDTSKNVYKCLDNANGSTSTVIPTGTDTGIIKTTDNYTWKYMYTIPDTPLWNRWEIDGWTPVMDIQKQSDNPTQWDVMNNALDGGIHSFRYPDGFETTGSVTIEGNGSGFEGVVADNGNGGKFINITNPGLGYTKAVVKISNGTVEGLEPIISPFGGHGFNAVRELNGHYVVVGSDFNSALSGTENLYSDNYYRQLGIMSDVIRYNTSEGDENYLDRLVDGSIDRGERMSRMIGDNRVQIFISNWSDTTATEIVNNIKDDSNVSYKVVQGSATGILVNAEDDNIHIVTDNYPLEFTKDGGDINVIANTDSNTVATLTINQNKEFVKEDCIRYSGNILYVENIESPRLRTGSQVDMAKMVLEF